MRQKVRKRQRVESGRDRVCQRDRDWESASATKSVSETETAREKV